MLVLRAERTRTFNTDLYLISVWTSRTLAYHTHVRAQGEGTGVQLEPRTYHT